MRILSKTKQAWSAATFGALLCSLVPVNASAGMIPVAVDWSTSITTVVARSSGASNTSVTDITNGVTLHFDAPSGGSGIGTATRRYDFETTAAASGGTVVLNVDLTYNVFLGFFLEDFGLQIKKNGSVLYNLIPDTFNQNPGSISLAFPNLAISLNIGDTWGVQTMAGNFTACCGYSGNINVTMEPVPEPGSLALLGLGLVSFGFFRRGRAVA